MNLHDFARQTNEHIEKPYQNLKNPCQNFRDPYKSHNTEDIVIEKKNKNSFTRPKKVNYASKCKNINKYIPGLKVRELLNNPNNCQFINKHIRKSLKHYLWCI